MMGSTSLTWPWILALCCILPIAAADESCDGRWMHVVDVSSGEVLRSSQMGLIASSTATVLDQLDRPANFLVFGVGDDSVAWSEVNCGGRTAFLENNQNWLNTVSAKYPQLEVIKVEYKADMQHTEGFFTNPWMIDLPQSILDTCWDVILVDSPAGYDPPNFPGRVESIYAAMMLAERCVTSGSLAAVHIYLHDATRPVESDAIRRLIEPHPMIQQMGMLEGQGANMQVAGFVMTQKKMPPLQQNAAFAAEKLGLPAAGCTSWVDVIRNATTGVYGNRPQLSTAQMAIIASSYKAAQHQQGRPANFLVFGVGHDSVGWSLANCEGRTIFLEENEEWLSKIAAAYPHLDISKVTYRGDMRQSGTFFATPWMMDLPSSVLNTCWDTILVDAPAGYRPEEGQPGRMESSYAAIKLAERCITSGQLQSVNIFLHDVGRPLELEIIRQLFEQHPMIESVGVLQGHGTRHLAGFVMSEQPLDGQQQQQQQQQQQPAEQQYNGPRTMAGNWRVEQQSGGSMGSSIMSSRHLVMSQLGFLLLGVLAGILMRSVSRWLSAGYISRRGNAPVYTPLLKASPGSP